MSSSMNAKLGEYEDDTRKFTMEELYASHTFNATFDFQYTQYSVEYMEEGIKSKFSQYVHLAVLEGLAATDNYAINQ